MGRGPVAAVVWEKGETTGSSGDSQDNTPGPDQRSRGKAVRVDGKGPEEDRQAASQVVEGVRARAGRTGARIPGSEGLSTWLPWPSPDGPCSDAGAGGTSLAGQHFLFQLSP